jgi:plasmid stabilization system protein ParE
MTGFVLHPDAYDDLEERSGTYIATDNLDAADRVISKIHEAIQSLVSFPYQGHERPDLTKRPQRFQTVGPCLIAYTPDEKPLVVTAALHGRRSPRVIGHIRTKKVIFFAPPSHHTHIPS